MTVENNQHECGIWDREGSCLLPLALLEALPEYHRKTILSDYLDIMGIYMNSPQINSNLTLYYH